jgi:hypothetical protein
VGSWIAIKVIPSEAAGVSFEMLKVSNHPIISGVMRPNPTMANRTTLYASRMQFEGIF